MPDDLRSEPSFFTEMVLENKDKGAITNLQKLFFYAVKFPLAYSLIKRLIKLPPNPIFELMFHAGYAWSYFRSEMLTLREVLIIGVYNYNRFFKRKRS